MKFICCNLQFLQQKQVVYIFQPFRSVCKYLIINDRLINSLKALKTLAQKRKAKVTFLAMKMIFCYYKQYDYY
jgi:hypothetical protein